MNSTLSSYISGGEALRAAPQLCTESDSKEKRDFPNQRGHKKESHSDPKQRNVQQRRTLNAVRPTTSMYN
jgi:hypothetical protein